MDATDFRIVGHLLRHPLDGPEAAGRAVGLTRNAVARRLRLLQDGPMRMRFFALPHHSLFGFHSTVSLHVGPEGVEGAQVLACPDVLGYDFNHDGLCAVTTWQPDPRPVPQVERLLGPAIARFTDATPGPDAPHLTRLEWKVALALLHDPRASAAALARATGLAARTCARARDRLVASRAVRIGLSLLEDRAEGLPVFRLYVQGKPDPAALASALDEATVSDEVAEGVVLFARAASMGAAVVAVDRVRALPGVEDVKLILSRGNGVATARVAHWIEAKLHP